MRKLAKVRKKRNPTQISTLTVGFYTNKNVDLIFRQGTKDVYVYNVRLAYNPGSDLFELILGQRESAINVRFKESDVQVINLYGQTPGERKNPLIILK